MKNKTYYIISALLAVFGTSCQKTEEPYIDVPKNEYEVEAVYTELNIPVKCNTDSRASIRYEGTESGWIQLLPSLLDGNGVYSLWISENPDDEAARTATLVITAGSAVREVRIVQNLMTSVTVSPSFIATTVPSGTYQVQLASNGDWTVEQDSDTEGWLTIEPASGTENGQVTVKVSALNGDSDMRTASLTFRAGLSEAVLTVQHGYAQQIGDYVWAKANVGEPGMFAASPDNPGMLYQYDSKVAWTNAYPATTAPAPAGMPLGDSTGPERWTDENNPCPDGWRVPTKDELDALVGTKATEVKIGWVEPETSGFEIPGAVLGLSRETGRTATAEDMKGGIFLPCAGNRNGGHGGYQNPQNATMTTATRLIYQSKQYRYLMYCSSDDASNNNAVRLPSDNWGWDSFRTAYPVRCIKDDRVSYGPVDLQIPGYDEGQSY